MSKQLNNNFIHVSLMSESEIFFTSMIALICRIYVGLSLTSMVISLWKFVSTYKVK